MPFRAGLSRDHVFLLPPQVDDWIPAGHVARVIDEAVELLDFSAIEGRFHHRGAGAPAYHPKMLLKLLIYGYLTHRFSSRKMSAACRDDLAMMWLAQLEHPKHSTIAEFRQQHLAEIPGWMAQVVLLCVELGMVGFRLGALDGSKIQADASKHKAMSYQRLQELIPTLEAEIAQLVAQHADADRQEDGPSALPTAPLDRLRDRLARIQQAKADLEARWAAEHPTAETPPPKEQINFTDPDSHIMVTKTQGVQQAYNGQLVVDADEGVIVATSLSAHPNDLRELTPTLDAMDATADRQFQQLTADAGYFSADNITDTTARDIDAYIAAGPDQWRTVAGHKVFGKGQFTYDPTADVYRCPADHRLTHRGHRTESVGGGEKRPVEVYKSDRATCGACPLKADCLTPKQTVKTITRGPDDSIRDAMKAKVRTVEGDAIYRARKGIVEPAFGIIKETLGFRQFSLRGISKVTGEWGLVALAYNVRKIGQKLQRMAQATGAIWTIQRLRAAQAAQ